MTTATIRYEAQVDQKLADLWDEYFRLTTPIGWALDTLHYMAGDRKFYKSRTVWSWAMSEAECRAAVEPLTGRLNRGYSMTGPEAIAKLDAARAALAAKKAEIDEQEALYTGWTRFFIVPAGHIHSSRHCSTCYVTTRFGWLPQLSGLDEADAVADQGAHLCSVCFPSAPVEWQAQGKTRRTRS